LRRHAARSVRYKNCPWPWDGGLRPGDLRYWGRLGSATEALVAAVRDGTITGTRLEEAADRVARPRGGLARTRSLGLAGSGAAGASDAAGASGPVLDGVGLVAARRAVRMSGPRSALGRPLITEVEPRENIAAGRFGWGLGPWAPAGSVRRVSLTPGHDGAGAGSAEAFDLAGLLDAAAGRSLVAVVRDAHRDANTRSLVSALLAARPDMVLVEMGLPLWQPPEGTSYLATYGASRASAQAAAELLGLVQGGPAARLWHPARWGRGRVSPGAAGAPGAVTGRGRSAGSC